MIGVEFPLSEHSTLSRHLNEVEVDLPALPFKGPIHPVINSSGFKVLGEGEWKVWRHGAGKRRPWLNLQIGVDAAAGQIQAALAKGTEWGIYQRLLG